ncbi:oxygen-independent coproporphyrinogen III oxidase [Pedobacter aquatilis]|uniref:oxygen-independent coproporphyrinogen III oxidase n=1 Tax=Pedobacter aquatilis TaxID=351343 RepID=UPI0025B4E5BA|nr:oxygen-independent coproporphyrinogen III oxidase [Pedobacter aquatilis]MDN3586018.1 oxygen-independent coproporphyrinogen III oxidase [Pedobacter aquatilis]
MDTLALLKKYNVAAPRYTSYPTVPFWDVDKFGTDHWLFSVRKCFDKSKNDGISLYIHLPFCESLCTYCGCNTRITKNHQVENPYIEALLKEWQMYVGVLGEKPKIKEIHLGGGTPTFFSAENLSKLIKGILWNSEPTADSEFSFEAHPDNTSEAHLQTLYNLGFRRLSLGIQDFDEKVQQMINRYQTPLQVEHVTKLARKIGYQSINFDLIYGLPFQSLKGLEETINQVINLNPDRIAFYSYAHVPWLKPGQRRYTEQDLPNSKMKFELYNLGKSKLLKAGLEEIGMDHFAKKSDSLFTALDQNNLHRNFMGYTHQHTALLIGLGVSSISDSLDAFAQNAKTVESYLEKINKDSFAIEKGHILTDRDLKIRRQITEIMCRGMSSFTNGISQSIHHKLAPLINDGLIYLSENRLIVNNSGKPFLRNICMAFDERLWEKTPATQMFSYSI